MLDGFRTWLAAAEKPEQIKETLFEGMTRHGRLTGSALTGAIIGRIVAEYGHAAGLAPASGANAVAPHDLRRTCAKRYHVSPMPYDNGAPLPKIQQFLGHANIETTMRYIGYDEDDTEIATDYVRY